MTSQGDDRNSGKKRGGEGKVLEHDIEESRAGMLDNNKWGAGTWYNMTGKECTKKIPKNGPKLNYSEFKHINLVGPAERVIKWRTATQGTQEQRRATKAALKMLKTQLTHNLAIK